MAMRPFSYREDNPSRVVTFSSIPLSSPCQNKPRRTLPEVATGAGRVAGAPIDARGIMPFGSGAGIGPLSCSVFPPEGAIIASASGVTTTGILQRLLI
ncbi:hypothetical protein D3C87_1716030 [compost metagenome]